MVLKPDDIRPEGAERGRRENTGSERSGLYNAMDLRNRDMLC